MTNPLNSSRVDHAFDPGLGLFTGLNVLPKCTAMSTIPIPSTRFTS